MDIRQVVAVQLREHRRLRKLTSALLARRAGVDRALIRRLEDGKANPSIDVIGRLAKALDIEPQELLMAPAGKRPIRPYPYPPLPLGRSRAHPAQRTSRRARCARDFDTRP